MSSLFTHSSSVRPHSKAFVFCLTAPRICPLRFAWCSSGLSTERSSCRGQAVASGCQRCRLDRTLTEALLLAALHDGRCCDNCVTPASHSLTGQQPTSARPSPAWQTVALLANVTEHTERSRPRKALGRRALSDIGPAHFWTTRRLCRSADRQGLLSKLPQRRHSEGWLIDPDEITICKRPDGSDHVLGTGSSGKVGRLQDTRHRHSTGCDECPLVCCQQPQK